MIRAALRSSMSRISIRVYAYVARRIHDRSETQDLTAHVFQQALANIGKFKWRGAPFVTWLYRIAANAIADQARKQSRELAETEGATKTSVDADLEQVERCARLFRAVEALPEDQRKVILLRLARKRVFAKSHLISIAAKVPSSNFNFEVWKIFVHDCAKRLSLSKWLNVPSSINWTTLSPRCSQTANPW